MLSFIIASFLGQIDTTHMIPIVFSCVLSALFRVTLQFSIMWSELFKRAD